VYDYIVERLRAHYVEGNAGFPVTPEMFDAVFANRPVSVVDFDARLRALAEFLQLEEAASLAAANKRIANILRKAGEQSLGAVRAELLQAEAERRLFAELQAIRPDVEPLFARREYAAGLHRLARLRAPVDSFFDSVMVMDENAELRLNRLALLSELRRLFLHTADLSRLPG
jgi:glycyl-tRNA synthetase beta chain